MPLDDTNWSAALPLKRPSDAPPDTEVDETTALLIRARAFIERGWCRFMGAQDAAGNICDARNDQAVRWCVLGALVAAGMPYTQSDRSLLPHPAILRLAATIGEPIAAFNNRQETVEPVLAAFDAAIAAGDR
jgi:hypothetical protein